MDKDLYYRHLPLEIEREEKLIIDLEARGRIDLAEGYKILLEQKKAELLLYLGGTNIDVKYNKFTKNPCNLSQDP